MNYTVKSQKYLKMNKHLFIQEVLMQLQSFMHIGLLLITERLMDYMHAMEFYLIMRVQGEEKLLLREKSQEVYLELMQD